MIRSAQFYKPDDIDFRKAKRAKFATKGLLDEETQQRRLEALKVGIEKLKGMKKEMEDERIREEIALNERLKNDIVRKREQEMMKKPPKPNNNAFESLPEL